MGQVFQTARLQSHYERLNDDRSRFVEGIAAICVEMLREEVRRRSTSRYSIIGGWNQKTRADSERNTGWAMRLDWIFDYCFGLYAWLRCIQPHSLRIPERGQTPSGRLTRVSRNTPQFFGPEDLPHTYHHTTIEEYVEMKGVIHLIGHDWKR